MANQKENDIQILGCFLQSSDTLVTNLTSIILHQCTLCSAVQAPAQCPVLQKTEMMTNPYNQLQCAFRLDILGKKFFIKGIVKYCNRLPRAVLHSPSLESFKGHVDVAVGDMV